MAADRYRSDPANGVVAERVANVYSALAGTYAGLASGARSRPSALPHWREARTWALKSREVREVQRETGPLSEAATRDLDSLVDLVARCDAALGATPARASQ